MMKFLLLFFTFSTSFFSVFSQTTLRVMQYNILYYGTYPTWCLVDDNDPDLKDGYLQTIVDHVQPDVFCVNELGAGNANAARILDNVMNSNIPGKFDRAVSTNNGFSSIVNMLYFNTEKLALHSQKQVSQDINGGNLSRLIDLYTLYINDASLPQTNDTTFITFIVAHLKAGSSTADQESRARETEALMELLNAKTTLANYVFSGDFNVKTASETSFVNIVSHSNPQIRFYDPTNQLGNWSDNSNFSNIHTQSTRVTGNTNNGCFASGGSDDRFDFILISEAIKSELLKVKYVANSHTIPGQDGNRLNQSAISPANTSAPANVITAIFEMSDHYPLYLDLLVDPTLSINEKQKDGAEIIFKNPVTDFLDLKITCIDCEARSIEIITLTGSLVYSGDLAGTNGRYQIKTNLSPLARGMYLIKISNMDGSFFTGKMVKL